MMEEFKKLLIKKKQEQGEKPVDENKMKAKADMAKEMSDMLGREITGDIQGTMKKVTVASDSDEGLKRGLDKAEEIIDPLEQESEGEEESEDMEESSEDSQDIEMKIAELEKQLEELKSKKA